MGGVVFSDYHVSPNFLFVLGLRLWLWLGLGCDKNIQKYTENIQKYNFVSQLEIGKTVSIDLFCISIFL